MLDPLDPVWRDGDEAGASIGAAAFRAWPAVGARPDLAGFAEPLIRALLDELDEGVVVCDAACRPVLVNRAAETEVAGPGPLRVEGGRLSATDGSGAASLDTDLREVALGGGRRLRILGGRTGRLFVAVQPLLHDGLSSGLALVLIGRRALCQDPALDLLAETHGLTPSERRVLGELLAGLDPACIAAGRGVELSTVRTQIASIRGKLGAGSIDDLIRLAAKLPSAAPPRNPRPARAHRGSGAAPIAAALAAWMASPIAVPLAPRAVA